MVEQEELNPEQILRKLNKLRIEIEEAKSEKDQKIGKRNGLLERLRRDFKIDSLEDAKKRIKNLDELITRRNKKIIVKFGELKKEYEF